LYQTLQLLDVHSSNVEDFSSAWMNPTEDCLAQVVEIFCLLTEIDQKVDMSTMLMDISLKLFGAAFLVQPDKSRQQLLEHLMNAVKVSIFEFYIYSAVIPSSEIEASPNKCVGNRACHSTGIGDKERGIREECTSSDFGIPEKLSWQ
jgi:hypothetical protein